MSVSSIVVSIDQAGALPARVVGGKARSLGRMRTAGLPVPNGLVLTTDAFRQFMETTGLADWIGMTLSRLPADPTSDELGDAALAIHARFVRQEWPSGLLDVVADRLEPFAIEGPVAVRSSTPAEDGSSTWMPGLHDSFIGVEGTDDMVAAVVGVWASTFSECALGYSLREGVDPLDAAMAVVVHPLLLADVSGVVVTENPDDPGTGSIEAVWGLGEGIVGGGIAPDRWVLERPSGHILDHSEPIRELASVPFLGGTQLEPLDAQRRDQPPMTPAQVADVWRLASEVDGLFGVAQECEWVFVDGAIALVQSRPVSTHRSIRRSTGCEARVADDVLKRLRLRIEEEFLPAMRVEADALGSVQLSDLSDAQLVGEARRRSEALAHWRLVHRAAIKPFMQGVRAFGRYHARVMRSSDPLDFTRLLVRTPLEYAERQGLMAALDAPVPEPPIAGESRAVAEQAFLEAVPYHRRDEAAEMLQLGRSSWSLCDNHTLYLLRLEREAARCADELDRRIAIAGDATARPDLADALKSLVRAKVPNTDATSGEEASTAPASVARQVVGQPAAGGLARGRAAIVKPGTRVAAENGSVLVVGELASDAGMHVDSATAIVEERGGAFTHAAIHARERGIPCVTGCTGALSRIPDAAIVTVDGHLGIVVIEGA